MTWASVGSRGSANNKSAATTITVNPSSAVSVDGVLVVIIATDNIGTTDGDLGDIVSVTDSQNNVYTKASQFTNGNGNPAVGATTGIYFSKITTALATTDAVTVTFNGSPVSKAVMLHEFSIGTGKVVAVAGTPATQSGTAAQAVSMTISGLVSGEYLWLGGLAVEGPSGDAFTQDTQYSGMTRAGTSGGLAASNMTVDDGFRIFTGTTDTYNGTTMLGSARDFAGVYVALEELFLTTLTDAVASSDALVKKPRKSLNEIITNADSAVRKTVRALSEVSTLIDGVVGRKVVVKILTDALSLGDSLIKKTIKRLSETPTLTDLLIKKMTRGLSELAGLTDNLSKRTKKAFSEGLTLLEVLSSFVGGGFTKTSKFLNLRLRGTKPFVVESLPHTLGVEMPPRFLKSNSEESEN